MDRALFTLIVMPFVMVFPSLSVRVKVTVWLCPSSPEAEGTVPVRAPVDRLRVI
jgi:hypothetical protein